jgi:hypothetical protein
LRAARKSVRGRRRVLRFFVDDAEEPIAVAGAIAQVARFGAGLPIVGTWRAMRSLGDATLGFRSVGPLRIWVTGTG